jgi:hypothetical protein
MADIIACSVVTCCERRRIARGRAEESEQTRFIVCERRRSSRTPRAIARAARYVGRTSRSISRILSVVPDRAIIHLRPLLPAAWCDLPGGSGEQPSSASADARTRPFDLAPGGVYRAIPVTWDAGGLLHRRFTLTSVSIRWLAISLVVGGGLLSVALSRGSPRVGVTHHLALWSPDFPQRRLRAAAIA